MVPQIPEREIFWNISFSLVLYILATIVVAIMAYSFYRRFKMWHIGKPDSRLSGSFAHRWKSFLSTAIVDGLIHRKFFGVADNLGHRKFAIRDFVPKELYAGIAHFFIFFGCIVLLIGTAMDVISHYPWVFIFGHEFLVGGIYLGHTIALDIAGLIAIIGVAMELVRRYLQKPERLDNRNEDMVALMAVLVVVLTGFCIQAVRLAYSNPPWAWWSPAGYVLSFAFGGLDKDSLLVLHRSLWWFHVFIALGAMLYIALFFNRLWHIIVSPLNVFFRNLGPKGALVPIDLEKAESFGVSKIEDFSWKHLLDLDACTRCGRCQDNCPAHLSGKPLSPKKVIQDLKANFIERAPDILRSRAKPAAEAPIQTDGGTPEATAEVAVKPMIGAVVGQDEIWNCTTCHACQEVCPVWIEPMVKLNDMRRNLVLEQCVIPETAEGALRSIEDRGHPWRGTLLTRTGWTEGLGVKTIAEDKDVEYLFWVGCTEALEERSVKVAQSIAKLFKIAGVKFAILGDEESCCGDPARRMGNEYLYQMQAQKNIEIFKNYGVKKIVTGCPHCYNSIKNEYPQFGGNYEVIHHSQLIAQLLKEGKLGVVKGMRGVVTYHDACYLGRYNDIFDAPRQILNNLPDVTLVEMDRNRERNFCCGAGGGHMWLEEQKVGDRINVMRTEQAMSTKAQVVATACPFCLQMFQDGVKTKAAEENLQIKDVAEILAESAVYHNRVIDEKK
jgi:Fe-S oxidoreductase/nitrate reductase gamma subunit